MDIEFGFYTLKAILHQLTLRRQLTTKWLKLRPFFTSSAHLLTAGDQCVVKIAYLACLEVIDYHRKVAGGNKQGWYQKLIFFLQEFSIRIINFAFSKYWKKKHP